jgi:urea-proton symporter
MIKGWVAVGIMWLFFSTACVGIFPLWQGRKTMAHTVKSIFLDITGKRKPMLQGRMQQVEEKDEVETPNAKVDEVYSKKD